MSDLSDQVRQMLEFNVGEAERGSGIKELEFTGETAPPALMESQDYYRKHGAQLIRRVYLRHNGCSIPESYEDAYEKFHSDCLEAIGSVGLKALADGVQMGQGKSSTVKRLRFFKKLNNAFEADKFHDESRLLSLQFSDDFDTMHAVTSYVDDASKIISVSCGLTQPGAPSEKIWDLWVLTASSIGMSMYLAGYELGKKWSEDDVLKGIVAATEQTGRNDG